MIRLVLLVLLLHSSAMAEEVGLYTVLGQDDDTSNELKHRSLGIPPRRFRSHLMQQCASHRSGCTDSRTQNQTWLLWTFALFHFTRRSIVSVGSITSASRAIIYLGDLSLSLLSSSTGL